MLVVLLLLLVMVMGLVRLMVLMRRVLVLILLLMAGIVLRDVIMGACGKRSRRFGGVMLSAIG